MPSAGTRHRQLDWRPHFYEIAIVVNLGIIAAFAPREVLGNVPDSFASVLPLSIACAVLGVAVRLAAGRRKKRLRRLVTIFRSPAWLIESVRQQIALVLLTHTYGWIKLLIPFLHPRLFDRELFEIDRSIFGGISPTIFLLNLFSQSSFLRFIDVTYANIFLFSLIIASIYFLSSPDERYRVGYTTSNVSLWLSGVWLYVLVPSLGPAYRFPEEWMPYSGSLQVTQRIQALLMQNYQNVLRLMRGVPAPVRIVYGIAAFPSIHVGFQTLVALWMRRVWRFGDILFGVCAFFIFIGSMITGWHYFVDGAAGALLAYFCYSFAKRLVHLKKPIRRESVELI